MSAIVETHQQEFIDAVEHLKSELQSIRSNRATPSLVELIKVTAYGAEMKLLELASITVPEPRMIAVQPWDTGVVKDVERALNEANLNMGISNDGVVIRLTLPALTTETRQALAKVLNQKIETARIQIRQIREKIRAGIVGAERNKEITEDDRFAAEEELDNVVKKYIEQINELGERKEQDIMTV